MDGMKVKAEIEAAGLELSHFQLLKLAAERDILADEVEGRRITSSLVRLRLLERERDRWRITEFGRAVLSSARGTGMLNGTWPPK